MTVEGMENVEMIAGKKHAPKFLGRVLILGLGKSGTAAAEYCLDVLGSRVEVLAVAAGAPGEAALALGEGARERGAVVLSITRPSRAPTICVSRAPAFPRILRSIGARLRPPPR